MAQVKDIILYPSKILRAQCTQVKLFDSPVVRLIGDQLRPTLPHLNHGVALAANQIGHTVRMFAQRPELCPLGVPEVLVNPSYEALSDAIPMGEGCLSIPGHGATMMRYPEVRLIADDLEGAIVSVTLSGVAAQAVQHEIDHLNGKLIVDSLSRDERNALAMRMRVR